MTDRERQLRQRCDPTYWRIHNATCQDSPINAQEHAWRIYLVVRKAMNSIRGPAPREKRQAA